MTPNTLSSSYVVNAPAEFMRQFSIKSQRKATNIHAATLVRLIEGFIELIRDFYEESLKMSPQEAQIMLNEAEVNTLSQSILAVKLVINQTETAELQAAIMSLVAYSEALVERINTIANRGEIDETSEDYAEFWIDEIAKERKKSEPRKIFDNSAHFLTYIENL